MKKTVITLVLFFVCATCCAEPYLEIGAFHLDRTFYYFDKDENYRSGNTAAHAAIGYELVFDSIDIDIQLKHQSDPDADGRKDLINNNAFGIIARYRFK